MPEESASSNSSSTGNTNESKSLTTVENNHTKDQIQSTKEVTPIASDS